MSTKALGSFGRSVSFSGKKKTSIYIDEELGNEWMHFILDDPRYGSSRKASEALEDAMKFYMEKAPADEGVKE